MLFRVVEERNIKCYRLSLLSLLSLDAQSYTNFLELKATNKNAQNVIYKINSYFPQSVEGARHITLLHFYENQAAVHCEDKNVNQDFLLVRSTLCFLYFIRKHLTGTINRGGRQERTVHRGEFSLHHYYKHKAYDKKCY